MLVAALAWLGHRGWSWLPGSPLLQHKPDPWGAPREKGSMTLTLGFPCESPDVQCPGKCYCKGSLSKCGWRPAPWPCPGIPQSSEVCLLGAGWEQLRWGCVCVRGEGCMPRRSPERPSSSGGPAGALTDARSQGEGRRSPLFPACLFLGPSRLELYPSPLCRSQPDLVLGELINHHACQARKC